MTDQSVPIRDAATVILVRDAQTNPRILMGQRGKNAVFMPEKVVFPGGAVDEEDSKISLAEPIGQDCARRLSMGAETNADSLGVAAVREVFEETGLVLGAKGDWVDPSADWQAFAARGFRPSAKNLKFFFRAITPAGRPRRFDARFFLADAASVQGDLDDFSAASDELSHLQWIALSDVRTLNLAFITRLVLAELERHLPSLDAPHAVPLVRNDAIDRGVTWLS